MGLLDKLLGKKPGYNDFAREMIRTLKSFGAHEIREDVATRSVRIDSADATYYLDNAFSDYVSVTAPRAARSSPAIRRFLHSKARYPQRLRRLQIATSSSSSGSCLLWAHILDV